MPTENTTKTPQTVYKQNTRQPSKQETARKLRKTRGLKIRCGIFTGLTPPSTTTDRRHTPITNTHTHHHHRHHQHTHSHPSSSCLPCLPCRVLCRFHVFHSFQFARQHHGNLTQTQLTCAVYLLTSCLTVCDDMSPVRGTEENMHNKPRG